MVQDARTPYQGGDHDPHASHRGVLPARLLESRRVRTDPALLPRRTAGPRAARPAPVPRRRDGGGGRAAFVRVARPGSVPRRDRAPLMPKPGLGPVAAGVAARGLM